MFSPYFSLGHKLAITSGSTPTLRHRHMPYHIGFASQYILNYLLYPSYFLVISELLGMKQNPYESTSWYLFCLIKTV